MIRAALAALLLLTGCAAPQALPTAFTAPFAQAGFSPERIARIAEREWMAFGSVDGDLVTPPGRTETEDGWWQRIGDYWFHGVGAPSTGLHDSPDGRPFWSAAFISYVMAASGAGPRFAYSGVHADYINPAIDGDPQRAIIGLPIDAVPPARGDIICQARSEGGSPLARFEARPARYPAHCDIVVAVSPEAMFVIGGNVSDTVARRRLPLVAGKIDPASGPWIALLRLR